MPVIFASIILTIPVTIAGLIGKQSLVNFMNKYIVYTSPTGFILYILFIMLFGYFWTFLQMNPEELSKDLNKRGGYIPGIRPGKDTEDYFVKVLTRLTTVGAIFLALIAAFPILVNMWTGLPRSVSIGGTSLLIVVGVTIETYKQLESSLMSRDYSINKRTKRRAVR